MPVIGRSLEDDVLKPVMNVDAVKFDDVEENGLYTSSRGQISTHIGAKKLGYNLSVVDACEYPDSQKVLIRGKAGLRGMFRGETTVDYYDREKNEGAS